MKEHLSGVQFAELCDLHAKVGAGDLLDFIHWVQRTARVNGWSTAKVLEICKRMPPEKLVDKEARRLLGTV